jgi:hypothetical protein
MVTFTIVHYGTLLHLAREVWKLQLLFMLPVLLPYRLVSTSQGRHQEDNSM